MTGWRRCPAGNHPGRAVGAVAVLAVLVTEAALVVCALAGMRPPTVVTGALGAVAGCLVAAELTVIARWYLRARRAGRSRPDALRDVARQAVPRPLRRLVRHEALAVASLPLWLTRRRNGVRPGDHPAPYAGAQTVTALVLGWAVLVETVVLALLIPWPVVHAAVLLLHAYTLLLLVSLHASCVVRPHLVRPDGSLRLRYGALFDLDVPPGRVAAARAEWRNAPSGPVGLDGDGVLVLAVDGRTSVTVELTEPLSVVRPLGRRAVARVVRCHADDPRAMVAALAAANPGLRVGPARH